MDFFELLLLLLLPDNGGGLSAMEAPKFPKFGSAALRNDWKA